MPAAAAGPSVQVFGLLDSRPTRAALRFFKERSVGVHFVDLKKKPLAPGELRRFGERLGARAIADEQSRAWKAAGLGYLSMDEAELEARLLVDVRLLRLPWYGTATRSRRVPRRRPGGRGSPVARDVEPRGSTAVSARLGRLIRR